MALIHHIEHLRKKPVHVKKQIAFFTSLGITVIIFSVWITSMGIQSTVVAIAPTEAKIDTPASSLTASIGDAWDYVKGLFSGANKVQYQAPVVEVSAGDR